jgi:hypothetical protein
LKKERREHIRLDQAILTTDHHYFETDIGIAAEGWQESHGENLKFRAGRQAGVKEDHALYVSCIYPGH